MYCAAMQKCYTHHRLQHQSIKCVVPISNKRKEEGQVTQCKELTRRATPKGPLNPTNAPEHIIYRFILRISPRKPANC